MIYNLNLSKSYDLIVLKLHWEKAGIKLHSLCFCIDKSFYVYPEYDCCLVALLLLISNKKTTTY